MKLKIKIHSSTEVKKAGGGEAYVKKHGLTRAWSREVSGMLPLTKKETLDALRALKD